MVQSSKCLSYLGFDLKGTFLYKYFLSKLETEKKNKKNKQNETTKSCWFLTIQGLLECYTDLTAKRHISFGRKYESFVIACGEGVESLRFFTC